MDLTFEITREDYWQFNKFYLKRRGRFRRNLIIFAIFAGSTASLLSLNADEPTWLVIGSGALGVLVAVRYGALCFWSAKRRVMKIPATDGTTLGERTLQVVADGLLVKNREVESLVRWSGLREVVETKDSIYLFLDTNIAIIVPRRAFPDVASAGAFLSLVTSLWKKPAVTA